MPLAVNSSCFCIRVGQPRPTLELVTRLAASAHGSPVSGSVRETVDTALTAVDAWREDARRHVAKRNSSKSLAESLELVLGSLQRMHALVRATLEVCPPADMHLFECACPSAHMWSVCAAALVECCSACLRMSSQDAASLPLAMAR